MDSEWCVGVGENSKEVEVQTHRNQREKETFYSKQQDIPSNPKEPWDLEMDFDDSLTPEIPTEPLPDADITEDSSCSPSNGGASDPPPPPPPPPEPDLELLTVLLKNPELVFALTSGQAKSMTSEETVALLDVLKRNGVGVAELVNRAAADGSKEKKPEEPEPTSLPSPTPPSDPAARAGWRSEFPISHFRGGSVASAPLPAAAPHTPSPAAVPPVVVKTQAPGSGLPPHDTSTTTISSTSHLTVNTNHTSQHHQSLNFLPKRPPASSTPQIPSSVYPLQHSSVPEPTLLAKQYPITNIPTASPSVIPSSVTTHPAFPSTPQPQTFSPRMPNPTPDFWIGGSNGVLAAAVSNQQFLANQINYNGFPKGSVPPPFVPPRDRNGILDSEVETWNPEGSPVRLGGRSRNYRPEWSRRWDPGTRDRHRPGRNPGWRDRDRGRRR